MSAHANPSVLIVDDDKVMGELLVALLRLKGYEVTHVHSGVEALEVIGQLGSRLDIVLCDIHMPGLRGSELVSMLLAARSEGTLPTRMLLLGMSGSAPDRAEAQLFDFFLHKPFSIEDFTEAVERTGAERNGAGKHSGGEPSGGRRDNHRGATRDKLHSSALPPLEEKTFAQLRSKLADDQLRQLYLMTIEDVTSRLERMAAAAKAGDTVGIRHEAHAIKGGCGMVGAFELQELAAAMEGGSAVDTSSLANFAAACQRLQRMLDERL
ncbi:MAG TPA: response regulator [Acidobacteriaceae bacterium]|jgi:CheY-like chemotaxis protein|nr:response regulator [Acidobacteriaceae bacterium]